MRYTIKAGGIAKSEKGEFATWAEVKAEWDRRIAATTKTLTPEEEADLQFAIRFNIPTDKSLKTLDARLAQKARDEKFIKELESDL